MRSAAAVMFVGHAACWSASKPAATPPPEKAAAAEGSATGGAAYGGGGYAVDMADPDGVYGLGGGVGSTDGRIDQPSTMSLGQPTSQGSLDKAIIRRYIKREFQKIKYCYERELLAKPGLAGTATIAFTIDGNGHVTSSTGSGLPAVDACVAGVIQTIEFPKPNGGGIVQVTYPFVFRDAK